MKNSIKKNLRFSFLSLLAVFLFFSVVSCNSVKQVPVYEGMTISTNGNVATRKLNKHNEEDKENGEGHKKHDELEEDISDVVEIDIITDDSVKYYVQPNETFIVEIHISNPNDFEIQSFTLNGEKYANYMFEDGSNMELLLLEVTAPSEPGYYEYTVDAIKYIDGEEIKNVDMSKAEKTVKTGIAYTTLPTAEVVSSVVGTTSIELEINVNDIEGVIEEDKLTIELSDGEQIVASKPLVAGTNNVKFDNLLMDKTYQYGIVSIYDIIDGNGPQINWLLKDIFSTDGAFELDNFVVNQESISFELITNDENATLTSIDLYDEDSGELITNGTDETKEFTNLLTNHSYFIQVNFSYINGEDTIEDCVIYENFVTKNKVAPTFEFEELTSDKTSISYKVSCDDVDGVTSKVNVLLLKDGEQVSDNGNVLEGTFSNLLSNTLYTIKAVYEYDLHDGNGAISEIIEKQYTTTVDSVGIEEIIVLNEGTVKVGEEMNLRIYFDNPSNIELTGIYVNGQLVEVVGGNRVSNAIIKFVPETDGGIYNFFVDQVNYLTHNFEVTQIVDSDISAAYPIYGELKDITFKPLSSIYTVTIYPGVIVEFDNSETNYIIYSINDDSVTFEKISEGKYLVFSDSIKSIEYGCEGYGTTTQIFDEYFRFTRVDQNIVYIYDNEDFLNMSGENYFILMNDLDFSKTSGIDQIMLNGVLDGNGHTITGLSIVKELHNSIFPSIFGYSGIVINTNFEEIYISCKEDSFAAYLDSNIFGEVHAYNCKVEGDVNIEFVDGAFSVRPMDASNELSIRYNVNGEKINVNQSAVRIEGNNFIYLDGCHYFDIGNDQYVLFAVDDVPEIVVDDRCVILLNGCFKGRSSLESLIINGGIKEVERDFFKGCTSLKNLVLPEGVETIDDYAFSDCDYLQNIVIPKSIESFGRGAFDGPRDLDNIYYNGTVEDWCLYEFDDGYGSSPLYYGGKLYFLDDNGSVEINGNKYSLANEIVIPGSIDEIGSRLFENCTSLEKVVIEDGVKIINELAFKNCENLIEIVLPNSLEVIETSAFSGCTSLEKVTIPSSVTSIGEYAFYGCSGLMSVEIPNGVISIGDYAFFVAIPSIDCIVIPESVEKIGTFAISSNQIYCEHDSKPEGWNENWTDALIDSICWKNQIILGGPKALVFGDNYVVYDGKVHGLEVLGLPYFMEVEYENNYQTEPGEYVVTAKLKSNNPNFPVPTETMTATLIIVEEDDLYYGDDVDYSIVNELEVTLYIDSFIEVEENVVLRKFIMIDQRLYKITEIGRSNISDNYILKSVAIPNTVQNILERTFINCNELESVYLQDGVLNIGDNAFENCHSLKEITIPDSVITLGYRSFFGSGIESITLSENLTIINSSTFFGTPLKSVIIPNSVTSIGANAFECCEQLENIVLSENLTKIDYCGLSTLSSLKNIVIPKSVTTIDANAFNANVLKNVYYNGTIEDWVQINFEYEASNPLHSGAKLYLLDENGLIEYNGNKYSLLEELILTDTDIAIKNYAFSGCSSLKKVVLGEGVKIEGDFIFDNCNSLISFTLPSDIKKIPDRFFYECDSLEYVVIPNGVESIEDFSFYNCDSLKYIVIPSSVMKVGMSIIGCGSGELKIYCEPTTKPEDWNSDWYNMGEVYWGGQWEYVDGIPTPISN